MPPGSRQTSGACFCVGRFVRWLDSLPSVLPRLGRVFRLRFATAGRGQGEVRLQVWVTLVATPWFGQCLNRAVERFPSLASGQRLAASVAPCASSRSRSGLEARSSPLVQPQLQAQVLVQAQKPFFFRCPAVFPPAEAKRRKTASFLHEAGRRCQVPQVPVPEGDPRVESGAASQALACMGFLVGERSFRGLNRRYEEV